jgi:SH3-like domain-containing protein
MACWASPEVAGPLVATLDSGVEVRVIEHQSHWAHIVCANGWTTWVDSRLLLSNGVQDGMGRS